MINLHVNDTLTVNHPLTRASTYIDDILYCRSLMPVRSSGDEGLTRAREWHMRVVTHHSPFAGRCARGALSAAGADEMAARLVGAPLEAKARRDVGWSQVLHVGEAEPG